jgi:hypothetical protein
MLGEKRIENTKEDKIRKYGNRLSNRCKDKERGEKKEESGHNEIKEKIR